MKLKSRGPYTRLAVETAGSLPGLFFTQATLLADRPLFYAWKGPEASHEANSSSSRISAPRVSTPRVPASWVLTSWRDAAHKVLHLAGLFQSRGLQPGARVCLLAENCPEWGIAHLAIMTAGGLSVPLYTTNTPESHRHIISDSGARVAVISASLLGPSLLETLEGHLDWILVLGSELGSDQTHVAGAGPRKQSEPHHETGEATSRQKSPSLPLVFRNLAEKIDPPEPPAEQRRHFMKALSDVDRDAPAVLIYTSGTSGEPRGVMLSHENILSNMRSVLPILRSLRGFDIGSERFLSFLPLSHAYEHMAGFFLPLAIGARVWYCPALEQLIELIPQVRPTIMTAVPRLYEILYDRIHRNLAKSSPLQRRLFEATRAVGHKRLHGQSLSLGDLLFDKSLGSVVRRKVARRFGGKLRGFISGGAPLHPVIGDFFLSMGVLILQGYGLTETSPVVSVNLPQNPLSATVGPPLAGTEVKIASDGEILVRGPGVMKGYWGQSDATKRVLLPEGWLATGDCGVVTPEGHLKIIDRKKDIFVTSGGDTIAPQKMEGLLNLQPEIAQALVVGDGRAHLGALVYGADDNDTGDKNDTGDTGDKETSDTGDSTKEKRARIARAIERVNAQLAPAERLRRFHVLDEAFSIENGLLTPSLKPRRTHIVARYRAEIEALYT